MTNHSMFCGRLRGPPRFNMRLRVSIDRIGLTKADQLTTQGIVVIPQR
jgi:hypothetical protein